MDEKKPFRVHVAETRHFEFEIWAIDIDEARSHGIEIWRDAPTTGQWELPDTETDYIVSEKMALSFQESRGVAE